MSAEEDTITAALARAKPASDLIDASKLRLVEAMRGLIGAFGPRITKTIVAGSLAFVITEDEKRRGTRRRARETQSVGAVR